MTTRSRSFAVFFTSTVLLLPVFALASEIRTGNSPSHAAGESVSDDLYLLGGSISSSGTVKGDLVTFGGNILINGPVSADIAAGGGSVTILSDVGDDVRVGGGTVVIQGVVTGDVIAAGGQLTLSGTKVGGDISLAGGSVRIDSLIAGDAHIAGGDIRINNSINGNVDIQAESITLGPKARIGGTLTYKSPKPAVIEGGALVIGETAYTKSPDVREAAKLGLVAVFSIWIVAKILMVFAGALVIGYVFQRYSDELVQRATKRTLAEFGRGVVFFIVTPVVSVLLLFTVVGIAFGTLGLLGFAAMMIVGTMLTPIIIGSTVHKFIFKQQEYEVSWKTILTGTIIFFVAGSIPYVGVFITGVVTLIGIGAAIGIKGKMLSEWR